MVWEVVIGSVGVRGITEFAPAGHGRSAIAGPDSDGSHFRRDLILDLIQNLWLTSDS